MYFEDVAENIRIRAYENKMKYPRGGKYKDDHVFDEEKSVKWNREEVARLNKELEEEKQAYNKRSIELHNKFKEDLIAAIMTEAELSKSGANIVYVKAYDEGHSSGEWEVAQKAQDLCYFLYEVMQAEESEEKGEN